jgi:acetyl esterase/lipase
LLPEKGGAEDGHHHETSSRARARVAGVVDATSRLRAAGVAVTTVRYDDITHDFMMLNPISDTRATRAAVAEAIAILRDALQSA